MSEKTDKKKKAESGLIGGKTNTTIGFARPISDCDGLNKHHWSEVHSIVEDSIKDLNLEFRLVSEADEVRVIHGTIVNNLFDNDIVIFDVSGKNPNVMFELGMRLAFDKPVIIIKDDVTDYIFDVAVIEHISYRRDLRFSSIIEFKKLLKEKINCTLINSNSSKYSSFLAHFKDISIEPNSIPSESLTAFDFIAHKLEEIRSEVSFSRLISAQNSKSDTVDILISEYLEGEAAKIFKHMKARKVDVSNVKIKDVEQAMLELEYKNPTQKEVSDIYMRVVKLSLTQTVD